LDDTERFTDLEKINLVNFLWLFGFWILGSSQYFVNAPTASKNDSLLKSGQKRLKNNNLAFLA